MACCHGTALDLRTQRRLRAGVYSTMSLGCTFFPGSVQPLLMVHSVSCGGYRRHHRHPDWADDHVSAIGPAALSTHMQNFMSSHERKTIWAG